MSVNIKNRRIGVNPVLILIANHQYHCGKRGHDLLQQHVNGEATIRNNYDLQQTQEKNAKIAYVSRELVHLFCLRKTTLLRCLF